MYPRQRDIVRIQCVDTHTALRTGPAHVYHLFIIGHYDYCSDCFLTGSALHPPIWLLPLTPPKQLCLKILRVSLSLNPKGVLQSSSHLTSREMTVPSYFDHSFPSVSLRIPVQFEVSYSCPRHGFGWHWRGSLVSLHEPMSRQFTSPVLGSPLTLESISSSTFPLKSSQSPLKSNITKTNSWSASHPTPPNKTYSSFRSHHHPPSFASQQSGSHSFSFSRLHHLHQSLSQWILPSIQPSPSLLTYL